MRNVMTPYVKAENVFLLEKNETLFKLGKVALENQFKDVPEVELIADQDENELDALVAGALENRNAGVSRVNPATYVEKVSKKKEVPIHENKDTSEDTIRKIIL